MSSIVTNVLKSINILGGVILEKKKFSRFVGFAKSLIQLCDMKYAVNFEAHFLFILYLIMWEVFTWFLKKLILYN